MSRWYLSQLASSAMLKKREKELEELKAVPDAREKKIKELVGSSPFKMKTRSETLRRRSAARPHSHSHRHFQGRAAGFRIQWRIRAEELTKDFGF